MMNDLIINVEKKTRLVLLTKTTIGNDTENLQEKLVFKFTDTFVNGQGRLEYKMGTDKNYIVLTKENDTYTTPVQNVITKEGRIEMQLVITEGTEETNVPVFKSNVFYLYCNRSLNAVNEAPEGYDLWIEQANAKLNAMDEALTEVDNLDIDVSKSGDTATITITDKTGTPKTVQIIDGENGQDGYSPIATVSKTGNTSTITITDKNGTTTANIQDGENGTDGIDGKDAKINGVNTLSLEAGTNITLDQEGSTLTISSTASGGTTDYSDLTNKPSINNITLSGNKTTSDLGLGTYSKPSGGIPSTDLASAVQTSLEKADGSVQLSGGSSQQTISLTSGTGTTPLGIKSKSGSSYVSFTGTSGWLGSFGVNSNKLPVFYNGDSYTLAYTSDVDTKQNITDNTLTTTNKTIPTAINEVNSIAKGANQAVGYNSYSAMITAINAMDDDEFIMGQNIYIVTVNVPDLWVSSVESTSSTYTYVDDATVINALETNGYIQVGYYKLSMLETQKVNLTNYVTNTDYATSSTGGVVKVSNGDYGIAMDDGVLKGTVRTYAQYNSMSSKGIVCKGTLENVITGKSLVSAWYGTQSQYDDLASIDPNTLYCIVEQ